MPWTIVWTPQAIRDRKRLASSKYADKAKRLINLLRDDPYTTPPAYEKLVGDLSGAISRRINIQHRLVYQVLEAEHIVKILSCWSHYNE